MLFFCYMHYLLFFYVLYLCFFFFFFFQAEDGIRDTSVTGVQTCALPILRELLRGRRQRRQQPVRRIDDQIGLSLRDVRVDEAREQRRAEFAFTRQLFASVSARSGGLDALLVFLFRGPFLVHAARGGAGPIAVRAALERHARGLQHVERGLDVG